MGKMKIFFAIIPLIFANEIKKSEIWGGLGGISSYLPWGSSPTLAAAEVAKQAELEATTKKAAAERAAAEAAADARDRAAADAAATAARATAASRFTRRSTFSYGF